MSILNALLDRSIVLSFDRSGFERHARSFAPLPADLSSKHYVITGANSGLGLAAAVALAERGAAVHLLCRNEERGLAARDRLRRRTGNARVHLELVDVSSADSIESCAARLGAVPDASIHGLVHNAGVLLHDAKRSVDGVEMTYATNILGSFRLTHLLRRKLTPQGLSLIHI